MGVTIPQPARGKPSVNEHMKTYEALTPSKATHAPAIRYRSVGDREELRRSTVVATPVGIVWKCSECSQTIHFDNNHTSAHNPGQVLRANGSWLARPLGEWYVYPLFKKQGVRVTKRLKGGKYGFQVLGTAAFGTPVCKSWSRELPRPLHLVILNVNGLPQCTKSTSTANESYTVRWSVHGTSPIALQRDLCMCHGCLHGFMNCGLP